MHIQWIDYETNVRIQEEDCGPVDYESFLQIMSSKCPRNHIYFNEQSQSCNERYSALCCWMEEWEITRGNWTHKQGQLTHVRLYCIFVIRIAWVEQQQLIEEVVYSKHGYTQVLKRCHMTPTGYEFNYAYFESDSPTERYELSDQNLSTAVQNRNSIRVVVHCLFRPVQSAELGDELLQTIL